MKLVKDIDNNQNSSLYYSSDQMITRNWGTDVLTYDEATGSYSYQQRDLLDSMNLNLQSDGTQDFLLGNDFFN